MNNIKYGKILNSISNEIKNVIMEQFNIGNMDLNNNHKGNINIFGK